MKNKSYIGISFIILVFGIIFIPKIVDRIKRGDVTDLKDRSSAVSENTLAYITSAMGEKVKVPDFIFTNQDSLPITNEDYLGKVYVLEFFFTKCPTICPIMNQKMKELDDLFGDKADFGIVSITIDPANDTPLKLKEHAELYDPQSKNWNFLTGKKETIYDLANNGFKMYAGQGSEEAGGFEHSGLFALIDKEGYIRSRKDQYGNPITYYRAIEDSEYGLENQIEELKEDIKLLLSE
ncbi:SCO family protein [Sungkyunkwania multivorans]|uniref:SCO family protein n=1 Tax=Sungkyunkwania multivorans TaxID=1173618 RepID=A0ABW3D1E3_9FLAO